MTALVTGASSGLGRAIVQELLAQGWEVAAAGRNETALKALNCPRWFAVDLSQPGGAEELYRQAAQAGLEIDLLVCNAGLGLVGPFLEQPLKKLDALQEVNMKALTALNRLFLPQMVERGGGRALNIASTGAWQPGPYMAAYYASKSYVLSLTRAVRRELHGTGVTLTAACPGAIATEFSRRAGRRDPKNAMSPEKVAKAAIRDTLAGRAVSVPGLVNKLGHVATKLLPAPLTAWTVGRYQARLMEQNLSAECGDRRKQAK